MWSPSPSSSDARYMPPQVTPLGGAYLATPPGLDDLSAPLPERLSLGGAHGGHLGYAAQQQAAVFSPVHALLSSHSVPLTHIPLAGSCPWNIVTHVDAAAHAATVLTAAPDSNESEADSLEEHQSHQRAPQHCIRTHHRTTVWASPLEIRFSQWKVKQMFSCGRALADVAPLVRPVKCSMEESLRLGAPWRLEAPFPTIDVVQCRCKLRDETTRRPKVDSATGKTLYDIETHQFAFDNRRLYCLQAAAMQVWPDKCVVEVAKISEGLSPKHLSRFRTVDSGQSIMIGSRLDWVPFVRWQWNAQASLMQTFSAKSQQQALAELQMSSPSSPSYPSTPPALPRGPPRQPLGPPPGYIPSAKSVMVKEESNGGSALLRLLQDVGSDSVHAFSARKTTSELDLDRSTAHLQQLLWGQHVGERPNEGDEPWHHSDADDFEDDAWQRRCQGRDLLNQLHGASISQASDDGAKAGAALLQQLKSPTKLGSPSGHPSQWDGSSW